MNGSAKNPKNILVKQKPIRVLQVVGGMVAGGIETWLINVLRQIDRDRFAIDFLVHTELPCHYDEEVRSLGSRIILCPIVPTKPWQYALKFRKILQQYGPYDIVHSHVHHFSGVVLLLAKLMAVPIRIGHSHNDNSANQVQQKLSRRLYTFLTKNFINSYANIGLGCSEKAAIDLFGSNWQQDKRWQIFYCGIELKSFERSCHPNSLRSQLGILEDAFVVGHIGRFERQKNHDYLIDIAAELVQREPKTLFLLIGQGILRAEIEAKVTRLGLGDRFIFLGVRKDVSELMLGAIDVLVLPSFHEGLPVVSIEAQAAGLPLVLSDTVTKETEITPGLLKYLSLSQPPDLWAETILAARTNKLSIWEQQENLAAIAQSSFNIQSSVVEIEKIYSYASI
jgi:glycosyltransferase involved in cell wall biosynthesis